MSWYEQESKKQRSIHDQLQEISMSPIEAIWTGEEPDTQFVRLELPHNPYSSGVLSTEPDGSRVMMGVELKVPEALRNQGIGKRLVSGLIVLAQKYDAQEFQADVTSEHSLNAIRGLTGDNILRFSDPELGQFPREVPITAEQAVQSLKRASIFESDLDHRDISFVVKLDMADVNISGWEQPYEHNTPSF